jgi:hypothetical protein
MKNFGVVCLRVLSIVLCFYVYFLTVGIIFFVPGGSAKQQVGHALFLISMSFGATILSIASFKMLSLRPERE